jgi:hypothetical protein
MNIHVVELLGTSPNAVISDGINARPRQDVSRFWLFLIDTLKSAIILFNLLVH